MGDKQHFRGHWWINNLQQQEKYLMQNILSVLGWVILPTAPPFKIKKNANFNFKNTENAKIR